MRVVIVGGGIAGLSCAQKLSKREDVHVTLLDAVNYYQFKPLLYQVATLEIGLSDVATSLRAFFKGKKNVDVKLVEIVSVHPEEKTVFTKDGKSFTGDVLVLACGSQANYFGVPGADIHSYPLYSFADAHRLRCQILSAFEQADYNPSLIEKGILNFVIVGAGPTGTELAGGLSDILNFEIQDGFSDLPINKAQIYLVDFLPEVLMPFSKGARDYAEKELKKRRVHLLLNVAVKQVFSDRVLLSDGSTIATKTLVWAGGVKASPLAEKSGLPLGKGNRIEVEKDLSVKGYSSIYAVGDCANIPGESDAFLPQLGSVAKQAGECAARNILRKIDKKPVEVFRYCDKGIMAIIGHNSAVANIGKRRFEITGFFAALAWLLVHAAFLPTFRQRIETIFKWIWQRFTKTPALQLLDRDVTRDKM